MTRLCYAAARLCVEAAYALAKVGRALASAPRRVVFRAGWADTGNPRHPFRRFGRSWVRLGPYVIGNLAAWDQSDAP